MKIRHQDVWTLANFISLFGGVLVIVGSLRLDTWLGLGLAAVGRILDVIDGPIARRTHSSELGALLDGTVDKLTLLALVTALAGFGLAPTLVIVYIVLQNSAVAATSAIGWLRKIVVISSLYGKRNVFMQSLAMLVFSFAGVTGSGLVSLAGYAILLTSIPFALLATAGYVSMVFTQERQKRV